MARLMHRFFHALARDRNASVLVELALILPLFAVLLLGGFEVSRMAIQAHEVEQIARSAAQWGMLSQADASDITVVEAMANAAAGPMAAEITVDASNFCLCPDGTPVACEDDCDGAVNQLFLKVVVTKPYDFVLNLQATYGAVTLRGEAQLRVR